MAHQLRAIPHDLEGLTEPRPARSSPAPIPSLAADDGAGVLTGLLEPRYEPPLVTEAIAHQLRSTLALISGYSQTVRHLPLDNDVRFRYLERITSASLELSELTEEMLAITLTPRRAVVPSPEPLSLRQLYARLTAQLAEAVDAPIIAVDIPVDLPLVDADPIWVALVIRNLVTNATKYARGTAVCVQAWKNAEWVVTRVTDGGHGVDPEERSRLFEPRFRGARAVASGSPGSGLGLYLCRRLVEAHGGRIWIEETGDGLGVCFSLPRARHDLVAVGPGVGRPAVS